MHRWHSCAHPIMFLIKSDLELISPHGFLAPFVMHIFFSFSKTILISVWITCVYVCIWCTLDALCYIYSKNSQGTPHGSPERVSCGVSIVSSWYSQGVNVILSNHDISRVCNRYHYCVAILPCTCSYLCSWLCNLNECWYCVCMTINLTLLGTDRQRFKYSMKYFRWIPTKWSRLNKMN